MPKNKEELQKSSDQILQGIRIVLPGTQAVIGFQFIAFFNPVFQSLSTQLKQLHFITLILSIVCSVLLIAPVAFQQLGEDGDPTPKFLSFTKKMLGAAMLLLLLAITGDIYVASQTINIEPVIAKFIAITLFILGLSLWYGYSFYRRSQKEKR